MSEKWKERMKTAAFILAVAILLNLVTGYGHAASCECWFELKQVQRAVESVESAIQGLKE